MAILQVLFGHLNVIQYWTEMQRSHWPIRMDVLQGILKISTVSCCIRLCTRYSQINALTKFCQGKGNIGQFNMAKSNINMGKGLL